MGISICGHLFIHKTIGQERSRGRLVTVRVVYRVCNSESQQGRMRIDMGGMCQDKVMGNGYKHMWSPFHTQNNRAGKG